MSHGTRVVSLGPDEIMDRSELARTSLRLAVRMAAMEDEVRELAEEMSRSCAGGALAASRIRGGVGTCARDMVELSARLSRSNCPYHEKRTAEEPDG